MLAKLTFPLSCHTFKVYGVYYSRFSSFPCKLLPVLVFLVRISGWLKTLLKHVMPEISKCKADFSSSKFLFHMVIGKSLIDPGAKNSKARPKARPSNTQYFL